MAAATIRLGKISSINYTAGKARVVYEDRDDSVTSELPFLALQYNIPKVDDLVVVACFSNGTVSGVILGPVYNSANTPHEGGAGIFRQEMSNNVNEAVVSYQKEADDDPACPEDRIRRVRIRGQAVCDTGTDKRCVLGH